jgi:hypothetical protein
MAAMRALRILVPTMFRVNIWWFSARDCTSGAAAIAIM